MWRQYSCMRGQLVEHLGQALLHHLELRERLAELHALRGVRHRRLVAGGGVAEGRPRDARAGRVQHGRGVLEPVRAREHGIERHAHVGERMWAWWIARSDALPRIGRPS